MEKIVKIRIDARNSSVDSKGRIGIILDENTDASSLSFSSWGLYFNYLGPTYRMLYNNSIYNLIKVVQIPLLIPNEDRPPKYFIKNTMFPNSEGYVADYLNIEFIEL